MLATDSSVGLSRIKKTVQRLPLKSKIEVLTMLEEELFATRFRRLLGELRDSAKRSPLVMEEITREVDVVRQRRYENCN